MPNITVTPGSGATMKTVDLSGVHLPASILLDADGNEVLGQMDAVAWDRVAASANIIQILKTMSVDIKSQLDAISSATAVSIVKQLSNNARQAFTLNCREYPVAATTEALINTFASSIDGATPSASSLSEYAVPAGLKLRITGIVGGISTTTGHTTSIPVWVALRCLNTGTLLATSPMQLQGFGNTSSGTSTINTINLPQLPDGLEFGAGFKIGVSVYVPGFVATSAAPRINMTIVGHLYDDTP